MGQSIEVNAVPLGELAIFDTDRSLSGQDSHDYDSAQEAAAGEGFPAELAGRLFEEVQGVQHVHVLFNEVLVRRVDDWDDQQLQQAAEVIRTFFIHYEENKAPGAEGAAAPSEEELQQ